eukprot:XP_006579855.1 uncharacterized protein LOC102665081 isoform X2 [Glycine max]
MATVGSVIKSPEISGLVPTLLKELCHPNEHTKYSFNILLQVGKSLLIKSLVKHYTKHNLPDVRGLITIISGKQRQVQFAVCGMSK